VGRTLAANRLLAGSACGKRRRGRPLNAIVRQHMDQLWSWGVAFGGMVAVNVLYMMLSSWIRTVYELAKSSPTKRPPWGTIAAVSLFHAGPWALIAAIAFAIYVHASPWAPWFFGGAAAWTLITVALVYIAMRKLRRQMEAKRNAA
jgi:hypothetical protein